MDLDKFVQMLNSHLCLENKFTVQEFTDLLSEYEAEGGKSDALLLSLYYIIMAIDNRSANNVAYWKGQAEAYLSIIEGLMNQNDMMM